MYISGKLSIVLSMSLLPVGSIVQYVEPRSSPPYKMLNRKLRLGFTTPPAPKKKKEEKRKKREKKEKKGKLSFQTLTTFFCFFSRSANTDLSVCRAKWTIDTKSCGVETSEEYKLVAEELGKAHDMVLKGEELLTTTGKTYHDKMMPATARRTPGWSTMVKHVFKNSADVLSKSTGTLAEGKA